VPSIQVVIVGVGPSRTALEGLAQRLGISERVRFMGERQDVPRLLGLFDIFVMPSLHEGFPWRLLEALDAGCPVIASAVGGVPEVVRDGIDGMLVPSRTRLHCDPSRLFMRRNLFVHAFRRLDRNG